MTQVIDFPGVEILDIPANLRALADAIECGDRRVSALAMVADELDGRIVVGLYGNAPLHARALQMHLMFAIGQRHVEGSLG